ncbi:MAG: helix-turn-helix domain-containing protein [Saezia sp.]
MVPRLNISSCDQAILDWIETELNASPRLDELATKLGYSKRMIQLHFKQTHGMTIGDYIHNRRLYRACVLLRMTELSVSEIACHLHFSNHHNFCRAFKKKLHCTPLAFRRLPLNLLPSLQLPQVHYSKDIDYQLVTLEHKVLYGVPFQYEDNYYQPNSSGGVVKIQRLRAWFQDCRAPLVFASEIAQDKPSLNARMGNVAVIAIAGHVRSVSSAPSPTDDSAYPIHGRYLYCTFYGLFHDYGDYNKDIYMHLLPKLNLKHRDARDIEFFHFTRHIFDEPPKVFCEYYIPVVDNDAP